MRILVPWSMAFLLLFCYYFYIQFPMERFFIKGVHDLREDNKVQALREFQQVLRIYPNYEPVYINFACIYHPYQRKLEIASLKRARMISMVNSDDLSERGSIYYTGYRIKEAQDFFNKIVINDYLLTLLNSHDQE